MGFRFRKRVSFGRFLRLNVSSSGVSLGVGPPGLNVNIGRKGVRKTVGLPGTGISYQTFSSWRSNHESVPAPVIPPTLISTVSLAPATVPADQAKGKILAFAILFCGGIWLLSHWAPRVPIGDSSPISVEQTRPAAFAPANVPKVISTSSSTPNSVSVARTPGSNPLVAASQTATLAPAKSPPLSWGEMRELQSLLKALGYDPGPVDGIIGPQTMQAVRRYAETKGLPKEVTHELLDKVRIDKAEAL